MEKVYGQDIKTSQYETGGHATSSDGLFRQLAEMLNLERNKSASWRKEQVYLGIIT